ncbi:MAG: hypothetical protein EXR08_00565 [Alphaproteobacteria bacterium]|nr:hypothetical protein [Alphaproteobacteria bacterium]
MPYPLATLDPTKFSGISRALQQASVETGTGFDHLVNTAMRESALNSQAKAGTSSASGMFQFIEQTWLGMVKQHGAEHGLAAQAKGIFKDSSGRYIVPDPAQRKEILALRRNTEVSALMAGELTNDNHIVLEKKLDRSVNSGELYAAHVLGASGAAKLITAAEQNPSANAAHMFPAAARANKGIFFENGHARSVAEVERFLTSKSKAPAVDMLYAANSPPDAYTPGSGAGLPPLPSSTGGFRYSGNSLAGLGHNSQTLTSEVIAIMASLDMPGVKSSDDSRKYRDESNPFGLTG